MRGAKPRPVALAQLESTDARRAKRDKQEPAFLPLVKLPYPPPTLGEVGKEEWSRAGDALISVGILRSSDIKTFELYCAAWEQWIDAKTELNRQQALEQRSVLVIENKQGNFVPNPLLRIIKSAGETVMKFSSEFGLTPSSRARLAIDVPKNNPLDKYLNGEET